MKIVKGIVLEEEEVKIFKSSLKKEVLIHNTGNAILFLGKKSSNIHGFSLSPGNSISFNTNELYITAGETQPFFSRRVEDFDYQVLIS